MSGRILADLGSNVVKVNPPVGEPDRLHPPFVGDVENSERSIPWLAANVNKRGITCDLGSPEGRALFARLAAGRRIAIVSSSPGPLRGHGLHPALPVPLVVANAPAAPERPLAGRPGTDP